MKCKRCRRQIEDNSLFCNWCGAKQITDGNVNVPKPKRLASGEYAGRVQVNGDREYIRAATESEYYRKARAVKLELVEVKNTPQQLTLDDVISSYIARNEAVFSVSTVRGYETNRRQLQKFTSSKVKDIDWQGLINRLSEKYAPKTIRNQWGLITAALKDKKITVPDVKLPPAVKTERKFLEPEEIKVFLNAVKGKKIELAALLALHSLRESEILAITKDSVKNGVISVRGAVVPNKSNEYVYKTNNKTVSSTRDIPVFIPRLTELWNKLEGDPEFPDPSNMRRDINRVCRNNALPEVSVHGLRHTFASLCYSLTPQIDIKTVMALGGWSSPNVPTEIYTHLSKNRYNADIKRLKRFYKK